VIRDEIRGLVAQALETAQAAGTLPAFAAPAWWKLWVRKQAQNAAT